MKHGFFKKLLSLLLAMTFVLSLGLTAAFAEGEGITSVSVEPDNDPQTYDIKVTGDAKVTVDTTTNTYTVDNGSGPQGVNINTEQPVLVEVNNNVSGEGTFHKTDVPKSNVVVYVAGSDSESAPEVTVELNNHNVSAGHADNEGTATDGTKGVIYGIYTDGSNATVTDVGTVTATVTDAKPESENSNSAQAVVAKGGSTVNVNTVQATGYEAAAVRGYSGSVINVDTAAATAVNSALAVDANNSDTKIEVNTATATATGDDLVSQATAIQVTKAIVNAGSAAAETKNGTAYGISVKEGGGNVDAGSVTATSVNGEAIAVEAKNRDTVVTVTNAVTATSTNGTATGIKAAYGASVTAGSVEAASENGLAIAVSVVASDPEKPTSVIVREDVQSSDTGVQVDLVPDAKNAEAVVEIGGTLKVDEGGTPVLIGSGVTQDNIAITVWKVEIDGQQAKEGEIVKPADENATDEQKAAAKAVEESIQYIIQIKPEQQSNIRSSKATAKANETFTVTVTPPDGKKLDAVYTDEGEKIEATPNDDGTYSVTVRVGGGMLLSAKFSDKPVDPAPAPVPVPVPPAVDTGTAAANDWAAATVRLVPENGAYTVTLTARVPTMTFLRQTLDKFAKYNDRLVIDTPYGSCEISLAELLNFNEKAVNFRIVVTSTALEIYVNGELFRSIPLFDLT